MNDNVKEVAKPIFFILLSACIIAAFFTFAFFTTEAEETQVPFPSSVPYVPSWDYSPFKDNTEAQSNLVAGVKQALIDKGFNNNPDFMITFVNYNSSDHIYECRIYYNGGRNGNMMEYGTYLLCDWLSGTSSRYGFVAAYGTVYVTTAGQIYSNSIPNAPNVNSFNNGYTSNRSGVSLTVGGVNGRNVVVYSTRDVTDISGNDLNVDTGNVSLSGSLPPGADVGFYESLESALTQLQELTSIGAGLTEDMSTVSLFERLYYWLNNFQTNVYNLFYGIWLNFQSLFQPMIDNIAHFFDVIYNLWVQLFDFLGIGSQQNGTSIFSILQAIYDFLTGTGPGSLQQQIKDALGWLFSNVGPLVKIKEIFDHIHSMGLKNGEFDFITFLEAVIHVPTPAEINELWAGTKPGMLVNQLSPYYAELLEVLGGTIVVPSTLVFEIPYTFPGYGINGIDPKQGTITLDFGWYARVKEDFLYVFVPFLYIGFFIYLIKAIPGLINGTGGIYNHISEIGSDPNAGTAHETHGGLFVNGVGSYRKGH